MTTIEPLRQAASEGPLLPATSPPSVRTGRAGTAPLAVRVNLLPGEVVDARRGHRTRRIVLVALVVLVLVLGAVSFFARSGVGDARAELGTAEAVNASLRAQQGRYSEVVQAQAAVEDALGRIAVLATGDVDWAVVTRGIRAAAPVGITVTGVEGAGDQDSGTAGGAGGASGGTGAVSTDPAAGAAPVAAPAAVPSGPVGAVTVLGFTPDPATVASYVDALTKVVGLSDVVATVVAAIETGGYSFSIAATVTADVLSPAARTTTGGR